MTGVLLTLSSHPQAASVPTKTTTTGTNSSSARKGSENEAYQMTEKKTFPEPDGVDGHVPAITASGDDDVTPDEPEPTAPGDCAC